MQATAATPNMDVKPKLDLDLDLKLDLELSPDDNNKHALSNTTTLLDCHSPLPANEPTSNTEPVVILPASLPASNQEDWTQWLPATDYIKFFKSFDWSSTPLGPLEKWSLALRLHTCTLLSGSVASVLFWGPGRTTLYNETFIPLAGKSHPHIIGLPVREVFPDIGDTVVGILENAEKTGLAGDIHEIPLLLERDGFVEESFFTGNFIPLRGDTGKVEGFYSAIVETTREKLDSRRKTMLHSMSIPSGLHTDDLSSCVIPFLEQNALDIPMALLYQSDEETLPGTCLLHLRGQLGVPENHPLAVEQADLNSLAGLIPFLRKAESQIMTFPVDEKFEGIQWRGFLEPSPFFSVLPLRGAGRRFGFLVLGSNCHRPIDADFDQFMQEIASRVSAIAASIQSADEDRKRAERLERELADREKQIRYMAEHASVGMQHLGIDGQTLWSNKQYCDLTGHPRPHEEQYKFSFLDVLIEEDRGKALDSWSRLLQGEKNVTTELRLKRMFTPPSGDPEHVCMLSLAFPYCEDGKVKSIMACNTDISLLKYAEEVEARNAQDAREAKRWQEEFIDVVSHEMRNPLSAIFHSADMISTSLAELQISGYSNEKFLEMLNSNVEAANTIIMCARHQKRIVDDVLTLSKLEYMLLSVSPQKVQPEGLVERIVRMFRADLTSHGISVNIVPEPSYQSCSVDYAMLDPNRVTQVFINLLTNAIKFTRTEARKEIKIRYGAVLSDPRKSFPDAIHWAPVQQEASEMSDFITDPEWGTGEIFFLACSITDTGAGMAPEEIPRLFTRFEQANAKTSIKYGGSGLGLFISQKLAERQGGEIGVSSELGKGSTFVFYIKCRRAATMVRQIDESNLTDRQEQPPSPSRGSENTMHVLLVEDNIVNQQVLRKQLVKAGCTVHVANHGLEALEVLRRSTCWFENNDESIHLDIILMDWEMPIMDGLTCSREIRALHEAGKITRHIEIIGITANAREEQIQLAIANGIDFVMSKPFMTYDLLAKMRERLSIKSSNLG